METRAERPLLLIDIAVPRDIEPELPRDRRRQPPRHRRRAADRRAQRRRPRGEARGREPILAAELDRFERWLASLEVVPTIAALRERGDEVVRAVLAENEGRWESLGEADRERLERWRRRSPRGSCTSRPCG
jgi:glutamyl-tRNA reductase